VQENIKKIVEEIVAAEKVDVRFSRPVYIGIALSERVALQF
jgi:hypothetical protein